MENLCNELCNPDNLTPLALSFLGDTVFDLVVRELIVTKYSLPIGELNKIKVEKVCCKSQAQMYRKLEEFLTEKEIKIYKWGRNAHVNQIPKSATPAEYHSATGLEALFGYLYLKGEVKRIRELISLGIEV